MHHRHTRLLGPRLHVNNLSIYSSILLLVLVAVLHQQQQQVAEAVFGRPTNAPKDYAPVVAQRRVKDLIEFFEVLDKSSNDVKLAQRTSVVLSLSESASKLYTLAHGMALEAKCNMYVKLISLPNIRNVATISALMKEGPSLDELVQSDANVIARLTSERNFEALARIQTIIQTLESERTLGKSDLEPSVEKELLECVNYYVYRHQQAVSSVVNYVHDSLASLSNSLNEQTNSKILVERFREPIERIVSIEQQQKHQVNNEQEAQFNYKDWLEALGQLRALVMENEFEVPQLVRDFLADPQRAQRLELWLKSDQLAKELIEAESSSSWFNKQSGVAQRKVVRQLFNLCKEPTNGSAQIRPPQETCKLLDDSKRSKTVKELIIEWEARKKLANSNRSTRPIAAAPAAPAATTTTTARTPEPVGSGLNASNAPTSEPTTNTLRHVKSEPDLNRQGLSAFLAGKTMITTPPRDEPTSRPSLGPRKKSFNFLNWVYGKDKQREDD